MSDLPLKGMRILIMEDEALIAMDVEQLCRERGAHDVVIVRSLSQVDAGFMDDLSFHAAILDVMLGGDATTEIAHGLKKRNVPFIFATGYTDRENFFSAFPDIQVVGKPYLGEELIDKLAAAARSGSRI